MNFEPLLKFGIEQGASDIHLQSDSLPQLRIGGLIRSVEGSPLKADDLRQFLASIAPPSVKDDLDRALVQAPSFSRTLPGLGRFRCSVYSHLGAPAVALRLIPPTIRSVSELNLPTVIQDIALVQRGLTLITGPSGSGRTTTLAAIVNLINGAHHAKIITIEDPVEYRHANNKALISHIELGLDTPSFEHGLGQALRQDPDAIVVGELRDTETVRMALRAADAGFQVLATMHSLNTVQTIERIVAMMPFNEQKVTALMLGHLIEAIVTQKLAVTRDGQRRPAVEILRGGPLTTRSILDNRLGDLNNYIAGRQGGMQKLDQHLIELYQAGVISGTEAMRLASNPEAVATDLRSLRR